MEWFPSILTSHSFPSSSFRCFWRYNSSVSIEQNTKALTSVRYSAIGRGYNLLSCSVNRAWTSDARTKFVWRTDTISGGKVFQQDVTLVTSERQSIVKLEGRFAICGQMKANAADECRRSKQGGGQSRRATRRVAPVLREASPRAALMGLAPSLFRLCHPPNANESSKSTAKSSAAPLHAFRTTIDQSSDLSLSVPISPPQTF